MNSKILFTGGILTITITAGFSLASPNANAEDVVDDVSVTVPISCTLSGTSLSQTATISGGTYTSDIGTANIKALCNDSAGFAVYAIGYTNDSYGNNKLHSAALGDSFDISTGKYIEGTTTDSVWAMKLTPVSGTYAPTIRNDSTYNYTDYEVVPSTYTKVASFASVTDMGSTAVGSNFSPSYAVYISANQAAGAYTGQVKFTIVHPNTAPAPTPPTS